MSLKQNDIYTEAQLEALEEQFLKENPQVLKDDFEEKFESWLIKYEKLREVRAKLDDCAINDEMMDRAY